MFYSLPNLTGHDVSECPAPWDFKPGAIPAQVRSDKESRQFWYMNPETKHQFYSPFEGLNRLSRVNKESNPPHALGGFVADYDTKIPESTVLEAIQGMKIKPTYIETSLSGYVRLIWTLESAAILGSYDYAVYFQQEAIKWLTLDVLPQLDEGAFTSPSRLYCNGGIWKPTGHKPISDRLLQAFQVKCGGKFKFIAGESKEVPLDAVLPALQEKYGAAFQWEGDFDIGAQGPTFWIPDSRSPKSAIVKEGGMFTFAAHAEKTFYSWADLLGKEFISNFMETAISKATHDIWFDGHSFWRPDEAAAYYPDDNRGMEIHLKVNCRLSSKPDNAGSSPVEKALRFVREDQRVHAAAFFVFRPSGPLIYDKKRFLNRYYRKAVQPSEDLEKSVWGPNGGFPFFSRWFDWKFHPNGPEQLSHFLSYAKVYYESALNMLPTAGQNAVFKGGRGVGKTFLSREVIGHMVGGAIDASRMIIDGSNFDGTYFEFAHWALDDDSALLGGRRTVQAVYSELKKFAANETFTANQKFVKEHTVSWQGRIFITVNQDATSSHLISADTDLDKLNMYCCRFDVGDFVFPDRKDMLAIRDRELPYFCRFLLNYQIPDKWKDTKRWGVKSYQEPSMLSAAKQTSPAAVIREVLIEFLRHHFDNDDSGTPSLVLAVSQLYSRVLTYSPEVMRGVRLDAFTRYMDALSTEGQMPLLASTGQNNIRVWTFNRTDFATPKETIEPAKEMGEGNFNAPTHHDCPQ